MHEADARGVARIAVGALAALLYANFWLDAALRGGAHATTVVSELEAPGEPHATLLRVTDVVCALLVVALVPAVRAALPARRTRGVAWRDVAAGALVVFAAGAALAAAVALPCGPGAVCTSAADVLRTRAHDTASIVSDVALYGSVVAVWLATRGAGPAWARRAAWWVFWLGAVGSSAVFGAFDRWAPGTPAVGIAQRVHILVISAWLVCLGVLAGTRGDLTHPTHAATTTGVADVP